MKKETIEEYSVIYKYLLFLKEPTYIFLIQVFQHLSPSLWWEKYIEPVLKFEKKENFKYLDISDMLNVFKMNWENIFMYLDNEYHKFKYDNEYRKVNKVHHIRNTVMHANDIDMSRYIFVDYLSSLLDYSRLINANEALKNELESEWMKYWRTLPEKKDKTQEEEMLRAEILSIIENKVLFKFVNCEALPVDIKLSNDRTILRLQSMRTLDEVMGFFNGALKSERGQAIEKMGHDNGLPGFEDIKDEVNEVYNRLRK